LLRQVLGRAVRQQPGGAAAANDDVLDDHSGFWFLVASFMTVVGCVYMCLHARILLFRFVELLKNLKWYQMRQWTTSFQTGTKKTERALKN
jgi:hypothetical protein